VREAEEVGGGSEVKIGKIYSSGDCCSQKRASWLSYETVRGTVIRTLFRV